MGLNFKIIKKITEKVLVPDFTISDTVYDVNISDDKTPLTIKEIVDAEGLHAPIIITNGYTFNRDGKLCGDAPVATLSHTPYDFVNGGFSQRMKKVLPDIPVNTLSYVKDNLNK